jgi:chorismate mutase/prephenate dehydratase
LNLSEHRKAIDKLDAHIVRLLNERTRHVLAIGGIKLKAGEEIYAPHREHAVFQRIRRLNTGPITSGQLRAIYREIMSSALALEKNMTIAYPGPEATFTHQAAIWKFGASLRYAPQKSIADVFTEVSQGRADYGVVPVENSTGGIVTQTLDMFVDSELKILSQIILPARQCLMVPPGGSRAKIRKLYVHPHIQDKAANAARFLVLGRQCSPPTGDDRTSLLMGTADKVGALHHATAAFQRYKINVTKIESRPGKQKAWKYFFFIDCDGHVQDRKVSKAVALLKRGGNCVKVLGSYPNTE